MNFWFNLSATSPMRFPLVAMAGHHTAKIQRQKKRSRPEFFS
ncbi:hypothetical protein OBK20_04095 [Empedobacter falsenii]